METRLKEKTEPPPAREAHCDRGAAGAIRLRRSPSAFKEVGHAAMVFRIFGVVNLALGGFEGNGLTADFGWHGWEGWDDQLDFNKL